MAPSFWFLNINMPIFLLKPFPNCLRKTWFKFLGGSPSKCWPNSMPVFVCIAIGKSGFLKKKSQNGRWHQLFSPEVCSVKPVLAEELKKIWVFMFKTPDFSLAPRLCKQAGLDFCVMWSRTAYACIGDSTGGAFAILISLFAAHCAGATLSRYHVSIFFFFLSVL